MLAELAQKPEGRHVKPNQSIPVFVLRIVKTALLKKTEKKKTK
jgi:hypothetical protein